MNALVSSTENPTVPARNNRSRATASTTAATRSASSTTLSRISIFSSHSETEPRKPKHKIRRASWWTLGASSECHSSLVDTFQKADSFKLSAKVLKNRLVPTIDRIAPCSCPLRNRYRSGYNHSQWKTALRVASMFLDRRKHPV